MKTQHGSSESMKYSESRFSAPVAKFISISTTTKLLDGLTAFMMLSSLSIYDSQRVSAIDTTSPSEANIHAQSTDDQFLAAVTYSSVASVTKQCDNSSHFSTLSCNGALIAGSEVLTQTSH